MSRCPNALRPRALFMAALAVGISSSIAVAQETEIRTSEPGPDQVTSSPEVVIVTPAHPGPERSAIGAPIEDVSLSASVRTDGLNLQSPADMLAFQDRVRQTARRLCDRLQFRYPIGVPDEYRCVRKALENTSDQMDAVIRNYRSAPEIQNP
jgi:UrcA family protein